eukprot:gnl/TRDRNA2_/TRDRNA2_170259_c0_seq1.p1 gnl/TRDRNA2_/TRDRNA2_170259_c0~~gnl/TRDRNA2_/TRDRNA2_170259_c0_seq1.p1  ORF type:complete len:492 (-),score=82.43 gnl/TRDRNA2_/TRDRNA2_170259_c0_seq1:416-1852(-)
MAWFGLKCCCAEESPTQLNIEYSAAAEHAANDDVSDSKPPQATGLDVTIDSEPVLENKPKEVERLPVVEANVGGLEDAMGYGPVPLPTMDDEPTAGPVPLPHTDDEPTKKTGPMPLPPLEGEPLKEKQVKTPPSNLQLPAYSQTSVAETQLETKPVPTQLPPQLATVSIAPRSKTVDDRKSVADIDDATTTTGGENGEPLTLGFLTFEGREVEVTLRYRPLGIDFAKEAPIVVKKALGHAKQVGIAPGWAVISVNGEDVTEKSFDYQYSLIRSASKWLPKFPEDPTSGLQAPPPWVPRNPEAPTSRLQAPPPWQPRNPEAPTSRLQAPPPWQPRNPEAPTSRLQAAPPWLSRNPEAPFSKLQAPPEPAPVAKSLSNGTLDVDDRSTTTGGDTGEPLVLGLETTNGCMIEATLRYRPIQIDFEREAPIVIKNVYGHAAAAGVIVGSTVVSINGEDVRNKEFPYQFGLIRSAAKWLPKAV